MTEKLFCLSLSLIINSRYFHSVHLCGQFLVNQPRDSFLNLLMTIKWTEIEYNMKLKCLLHYPRYLSYCFCSQYVITLERNEEKCVWLAVSFLKDCSFLAYTCKSYSSEEQNYFSDLHFFSFFLPWRPKFFFVYSFNTMDY